MEVRDVPRPAEEEPGASLAALAAAAAKAAGSANLDEALDALAGATVVAAAADAAVIRVRDANAGALRARAVAAGSTALAAELAGSVVAAAELPSTREGDLAALPEALRRAARRAGARAALVVPVSAGGQAVGSVEVYRAIGAFGADDAAAVELAAAETGLAIRAFGAGGAHEPERAADVVQLAGDALAAGFDTQRAADQVARVAAEATGATCARVWHADDGGAAPVLVGAFGRDEEADSERAAAALRALTDSRAVVVERPAAAGNGRPALVATLRLGEPAFGALQLEFSATAAPAERDLERLARFAVRTAHALRESERAGRLSLDLERTQALLAVLGEAIARLELAHTLDTAVDRVPQLLGAERVAVYLRDEEGRLHVAAARGLAGRHVDVAERLLELALGPARARGMLVIADVAGDGRLGRVADSSADAAIEAAVAVPLIVHEELIGLLAVFPERGRVPSSDEAALLSALAVQLAVAVQNARLHERVQRERDKADRALVAEQQAARELRSLYEISRSFVQHLTLEATMEAVARSVVELLAVDAAVLRTPDDERGAELVARAVHVADARLTEAVRPILSRPQPLEKLPGRRMLLAGKPLVLDVESARRLGASYELLVPFLERGSTCVVLPVGTATELLATLTLLSLDPARPITERTIELGLSLVRHAAVAIDRARLYEQQKDFSDTMQRSLLPDAQPDVRGLDVGAVYASSARVEVGGDVYDFVTLPDGRLAVVLGDVTGHGVDATADMAMAKFVFRSLSREYSEPGAFLAHANEVVLDELGAEKFVTLLYVTIDPASGDVRCACAGHPSPRIVRPDGAVEAVDASGLALGIDLAQSYDEVRDRLDTGAAVVLYTDGVVEARRRNGELYGVERLDQMLAEQRSRPAAEIAEAAIADCRAFAGGDLSDDAAIVVVKKT